MSGLLHGRPGAERELRAGTARRAAAGACLGLVLLLAAGGCERRVLWSYRDDPYFAPFAALSDEECLRRLESFYTDDRRLALRMLAYRSRRARLAGETQRAERLVKYLVEQFFEDKSREVRECIVCVCMPECGQGSPAAERFLRRLVAQGRWGEEASLSLAALRPSQGLGLLLPLARHPSPAVRYRAALALTALGERGGREAVRRVVEEMKPPAWPANVGGRPLALARADLERRARRLWGDARPAAAGNRGTDGAEAIRGKRCFRPRPGPAAPVRSRTPRAGPPAGRRARSIFLLCRRPGR